MDSIDNNKKQPEIINKTNRSAKTYFEHRNKLN